MKNSLLSLLLLVTSGVVGYHETNQVDTMVYPQVLIACTFSVETL